VGEEDPRETRIILGCFALGLGIYLILAGLQGFFFLATDKVQRPTAPRHVREVAANGTGAPKSESRVHLTGELQGGPLQDPQLGFEVPGVRYRRTVQVFQDGDWGAALPAAPLSSLTLDASGVKIGVIVLGVDTVENLEQAWQPYTGAVPDGFRSLAPGQLFRGKDPEHPASGDLRLRLEYVATGTFSVLGYFRDGAVVRGNGLPGKASAQEIWKRTASGFAVTLSPQQALFAALIFLGLFIAGLPWGYRRSFVLAAALTGLLLVLTFLLG
jgi:hypothetical protein